MAARIRRPAAPLLVAAALVACASDVRSEVQLARALTDLSLEQLASIEVTTVGKRAQRLADVPGSVYIISHEDIRRSGAVSLAEVLRLAPNLQVSRADANQYAISARGFTSVLANKMLVLVDGRTVYSPLFSGVFWEAQELSLTDVERIEVLSGAGGTLYGSNAVNGVINIITRSAADTGGTLLTAGSGSDDSLVSARHGRVDPAGFSWRIYGRATRRDASELAAGGAVRDSARQAQTGFRADRSEGGDQLTLQGDLYQGRMDMVPGGRTISGANLLARHTRDGGAGVRSQWQAYYDRTERQQPGSIDNVLDTVDLDYQQLRQAGSAHDLIWGAGWRWQDDRSVNLAPAVLAFLPPQRRMHLGHVFAQDEWRAAPGLRLTGGIKLEHNSYTGLEVLPNARVAWEFRPQQLLWASASRTVRTPSRVDRDFIVPPAVTLGGPDFRSEVARVFELGWRGQPLPAWSYAFTLFHHRFDRLRSVDAGPAGTSLNNDYIGRLHGLESWGQWRASETWRLHASYTAQRLRLQALPGTAPVGGTAQLGNDAPYRATLGAAWDIGPDVELDLHLRRVGALPDPVVPAYTALDARLGWHARPGLELSVAVRNIGGSHVEWGAPATRVAFGPSVFVKAVWRLP